MSACLVLPTSLAILAVVCEGEGKKLGAWFKAPPFSDFTFDDLVEIQYRVDDGAVFEEKWLSVSTSVAFAKAAMAEAFAHMVQLAQNRVVFAAFGETIIFSAAGSTGTITCIAPGSLDTSLSHAAGLSDIAVCHA